MSNLKNIFISRCGDSQLIKQRYLDKAVAEMKDRYRQNSLAGKSNGEDFMPDCTFTPIAKNKRKHTNKNDHKKGEIGDDKYGLEEIFAILEPHSKKTKCQPDIALNVQFKSDNIYFGKLMWSSLWEEAKKTQLNAEDQSLLINSSSSYISWAKREYPKLKNLKIIAAFAIEMAYERIFISHLSFALCNDPCPSVLKYMQGIGFDKNKEKQPIENPTFNKHIHDLIKNTASYAKENIKSVNILNAFCGMKPANEWALDPIRPPVQAIRTAAALIKKEFHMQDFDFNYPGKSSRNILGVELGKSEAANALAAFLPGDTIYTASLLFKDSCSWRKKPDKYDAVVVNLPNAAAMEYTKDILDKHASNTPSTITREEVIKYLKWPSHDSGTHCPAIMKLAMSKLSDNGVLIVLGDIESNQLHIANSIIEKENSLKPISIGKNEKPVMFQYAKGQTMAVDGVLKATGRLMKAWKRS